MYFSKSAKREAEKRYIRLDKHLQRLVFSGFVNDIRKKFEIPQDGYSSIEDFNKLLGGLVDRGEYDNWTEYINEGLKLATLPVGYFKNVEQLVGINFSGVYDTDQKGVTHHRTDRDYFRSKKITELYSQVNPKTGKKAKSNYVAEIYQIPETDYNKMSQKKADRFVDKFNLGGPEVRKIASKFKKQILK